MTGPILDKFEIARTLREIGLLLELKGENSFKVKAYQNGAEALEKMPFDLGELVDTRKLTTVRGIGEALAAKISELFVTGRSEFLENLQAELPPGVIELSQVPGLSTKKIQALHEGAKALVQDLGGLQNLLKRIFGLFGGGKVFGLHDFFFSHFARGKRFHMLEDFSPIKNGEIFHTKHLRTQSRK